MSDRRSIEHYIPAEFSPAFGLTYGENALHVSVSYDEGGNNFFTGGRTPRGYHVSVSAVKRADGSTSFVIGGGGFGRRYFIAPATRYNAKLLAAINAAVLPKLASISTLALAGDYAGLAAVLSAVTAEVSGPQKKTA